MRRWNGATGTVPDVSGLLDAQLRGFPIGHLAVRQNPDVKLDGGPRRFGNITDPADLAENLRQHCIPDGVEHMTVGDYPAFLAERRKLVALRMKTYFGGL